MTKKKVKDKNKNNVITKPKFYLFIGSSGSGKTFASKKILEEDLAHVDKMNRYLISKTAKPTMDDTLLPYFDEDNIENVYSDAHLEAFVKMVEDEREEIYNDFYYDEDIIEFTRTKKKKKGKPQYNQFILMVDDFIENMRNANKVDGLSAFITKARHFGIHLIFTSQYYLSVSPVIRSNMKYLYFFGCNQKELKKICEEHNIFRKNSDFELYFRFLTMEQYSCMIVNNNNETMKILDDNSPTPMEFKRMIKTGEIDDSILL